MIRRLLFSLVVFACFAAGSRLAEAQNYRGTSDNPIGPTVSPYLNLINSNQFGTTNYQSLVRPLVQQGNAINRQGGELNRLQQQVTSQRAATGQYAPSATGHVTFFMNTSHFYPVPQDR
jgi:hypothetical protein